MSVFFKYFVGLSIILSALFCFKQMDFNSKQVDLSSEKVVVKSLPNSKEFFSSKNQLRRNIENDYLRSIIPVIHSMPRYTARDFAYQNYARVFEENYPHLSDALKVNSNYGLYDISRFKETPKVYIGMPNYLRQDNISDVNPETIKYEIDVPSILMKKKLHNYLIYTENDDEADIFIFPIYSDTSLIIRDRLIVSSHSSHYPQYGSLFEDIKKAFFNVDYVKLNQENLRGAIVKDDAGNILTAYCPFDVENTKEEILHTTYLCLIQALGLPGFYMVPNPNKSLKVQRLLSIHHCDAVKPQQSFFEIEFDDNFYDQCVTANNEKDLKNVK